MNAKMTRTTAFSAVSILACLMVFAAVGTAVPATAYGVGPSALEVLPSPIATPASGLSDSWTIGESVGVMNSIAPDREYRIAFLGGTGLAGMTAMAQAVSKAAPTIVLLSGQVVKLGCIPSEDAIRARYPRANLMVPKGLGSKGMGDLTSLMPPVGNQGGQGSCAAWAMGYYYKTYQEANEHGWRTADPTLASTDHQFSPAFLYNQINGGEDAGSSFFDGMTVMNDKGAATMTAMPYDWTDWEWWPGGGGLRPGGSSPSAPASVWKDAIPYRAETFSWSPTETDDDLAALKAQLDAGHPFVVAFSVMPDFDTSTAGDDDFYEVPQTSDSADGYHGICIVGYDDDADWGDVDDSDGDGDIDGDDVDIFGGFKFINSWGASWAGDGCAYLSYEFFKMAYGEDGGVSSAYFMTDKIGYAPTAWAEVDIKCESRDDMRVTLRTLDGSASAVVFNQQGSDNYMDIHAWLDLTDAVASLPPTASNQWELKVEDLDFKHDGYIEKFAIEYPAATTQESVDTLGGLQVPMEDLSLATARVPGPGSNPPTLTDGSHTPLEGLQAADYTFGVTYTDLDDDPPTDGRVQLLIENTTAGTALQSFDMVVDTSHANPLLYDGDYTNGEAYTVTMPGISADPLDDEIGDGHHQYHFLASDGSTSVRLPESAEEDGPLVNDPPEAPTAGFDPQSPDYPASQDTADIVVIHTASPTISWDAGTDLNATDSAGTLHYVLQLAENKTFTPIAFEYATADGTTSYDILPTAPLSEGIWYYRLRTVDDDDEPSAAWSYAGGDPYDAVTVFSVDLNQPPYWDAGTLTAADFTPTGNIRTLLPLFEWAEGSDVDAADPANTLRYRFQLDNNSDYSSPLIDVVTAPGVAEYQLTAGQELQQGVTYYWHVLVMDDQDLMSDWCEVELSFDPALSVTPVINSVLTNGTLTPVYGGLTTNFFFRVDYYDGDDLPPSGEIQVDIGGGTLVEDMVRDPGDPDAWNAGVTYTATVNGATLGYGTWFHLFQIAGTDVQEPPAPGVHFGPVIGDDSVTRFTDNAWADVTAYEENETIYVEVTDLDENTNGAVLDTLEVDVYEDTGTDGELVTLEESGVDTGIFRASIPSSGAPGAVNDGVLNVAGGPTGNTVTASYSDHEGGDTSQDTAVVGDSVAPAAVGGSQLTATSGPSGKSVDLDWTLYGEAGQLDVAGYNIYQDSAPFVDTTGMTPVMTTVAGVKTATIPGLTRETAYYFAVGPFDSVPNERTAVVSKWVKTKDIVAPYLANQTPAVGEIEVPLDTDIALDVQDDGSGTDIATVQLVVNGKWVTNKATLTDTGGGTVHIAYDPAADFSYNETVDVRIVAKDLAGNALDETYQFSTVTDVQAPQVANQVFDAVGGWFTFELTDNLSGVDTPTIVVTVDGTDVTASCVIDDTDPLNVSVRYDAPGGWGHNNTIDITIDASDVAGNAMATVNWQEQSLTDNAAPIIDNFAPAAGEQTAPVDTTISARVRDTNATVDVATVNITVETAGVPVAGTLVKAKGELQVDPVFTPDSNLGWDTTYDVTVDASDDVGNAAQETWSFKTALQPTFDIAGTVVDAIGDPMPGVDLSTDGKTTVSDGTGVYRLRGFVAGTYTVTAQRTGYDFTPPSQDATVGPSAQHIDFVGRERTYDVSGTVSQGGVGVIGVEVNAGGKTATTDANGDYTLMDLTNGNYTATCSRDVDPADGFEDYRYTPSSRAVSVQGADAAGVDFEATPLTYSISGVVTDSSGNRIPGVTVGDGTRTAVTNEAGRYTIAGVPASSVTITPVRTGYAFSPASAGTSVPPDSTDVNFTAYMEFTHRFPAGQSMVALPLTPPPGSQRMVDIFGTTDVARYVPTNSPPSYARGDVDPDHPELQAEPGKGYFVLLPAARTIAVPGDPVQEVGSFSVALAAGWNQVGNMYQTALPLANMNAAGGGELRPFAFIYDNAIGNYRLISRDPALNSARNYMEAWEAAWFRAVGGGVSVIVSAPAGVVAADLAVGPAAAEKVSDGGWTIPIVASIGGSVDMTTLAGVGNGSVAAGYRVENPPKAPNSVDVYFTDGAGGRLAHDVRPLGAANTIWDFVVETDVASATVELTLPDLSGVPNDQVVYLTDVDTGKKMYARTLPSYGFEAGESGAQRHFQLSVEDKGADHLMITSASVQSSANGAVVTYSVSTPCEVTIQVLNIAGRKVRSLTQARPAAAGAGTLSWNLRNDDGVLAPAGQYLVTIEAIADNGQRVQALRPLHVTR
jgi:hypothetical protein